MLPMMRNGSTGLFCPAAAGVYWASRAQGNTASKSERTKCFIGRKIIEAMQSQRLSVMHATVNHFVPQRLMHALRYFVVDPGIRRDLNTSLAPRPILCRSQKFFAYPFVPMALSNI